MGTDINTNLNAYGVGQPLISVPNKAIVTDRDPTSHDKAQIGQIWVNQMANIAYILVGIVNNQAIWGTYATPVVGNLVVGGSVTAGLGFVALAGGITSTGASSFTGATSFTGVTTFVGNVLIPNANLTATNGTISAFAFQTTDVATNLYINQNGIYAAGANANIDVSVTTKGSGAFVIDGITGGGLNSQWRTSQSYIQTANAVPTVMFSIPIAPQEMIFFKAYVNGFKSTFDHSIGGEITIGAFRSTLGNVEQIGQKIISVYVDDTITAGITIDAEVDIPSQSVLLYVTGATGELWNWVTTYSYMYTTHP